MKPFLKFYFQPKCSIGGYNISQIHTIINSLKKSQSGLEIFAYFADLFTQLTDSHSSPYIYYFSGCIKNLQINNYRLDFNDLSYEIDYENVRFDGCPNVENFYMLAEYTREGN